MINKFSVNALPLLDAQVCNVCFSAHISKVPYTFTGKNTTSFILRKDILRGESRLFTLCSDCDYSFCPENFHDDIKTLGKGNSKPGCVARIGDGITPGREYFMAMNAANILKEKKIKILIFSPGFNKDHVLIRKSNLVSECKIMDLKNFQNSEYFLPIDTKEIFDVIVVCEVVEHFTKPREEFSRLFSYLNKDGLLIISTCVRQKKNFSASLYPFLTGHTSYYSNKTLMHLARMNNLYIDFRAPVGQHILGKTKRYIYMTKSRDTYFTIVNHFSVFPHPPSEYTAINHPGQSPEELATKH